MVHIEEHTVIRKDFVFGRMVGGVTIVISYSRLHKNVSMLLHKVHMKSILRKFHWQCKSKDLHSKYIGTRMVGKQVYKLYNVTVIKSRISWARYVVCMGQVCI
jgi:hypothetical protein